MEGSGGAVRWEVQLPGVPRPVQFDDGANARTFAEQQAGGHPGDVVLSGYDAGGQKVEEDSFSQRR